MCYQVTVINRYTKIPGMDNLIFTFDDNSNEGGCEGEFYLTQLDTCFPFHFCMGKESLKVFREGFKKFSEFRNRVICDDLVERTEDEDILVPFDVKFPIDMSTEHTCFDLGGSCKSVKYLCIKCTIELRDKSYLWGKDSGHVRGNVYFESNEG